jgi:hypothetical protein
MEKNLSVLGALGGPAAGGVGAYPASATINVKSLST